MSEPYIGEIRIFPYTYYPQGWLECNGQQLNIASYQPLFAVIGKQFGGNGTTNFNLPNLSGNAPVGVGQGTGLSAYTLGENTGAASVSLNQNQLPAHSHGMIVRMGSVTASGPNPYTANPNAAMLALTVTRNTSTGVYTNVNDVATSANAALGSQSLTTAGTSAAHENRQPFLAFRFCIAWQGIFPVHS
jgi:microcystin-dependent protein